MQEKPAATTQAAHAARSLWHGRFQGVLSTLSVEHAGHPFGSVVPYCLDGDGLPLLLLSHLAQHTRNLVADPRCSLTIAEPVAGDLQRSGRLTCIAECVPLSGDERAPGARYLRYYPSGVAYFEALNFRFYRLRPLRFHFNGGFATARWLSPPRVVSASPFSEREELQLLGEIEASLGELLERLLPASDATRDEPVCAVGLDATGLDLRRGDRLAHTPFTTHAGDSASVLAQLARL